MTHRVAIYSAAFALLLATPAAAHHPGSTSNTGGAGPITTISATTLEQGHFTFAVLYEFIRFGGLDDAALIAAAANHIHAHSLKSIQSVAASIGYGITDELSVFIRLPWVGRTDIREGHHSHGPGGNTVDFRGDTTGIGDTTVLGQFRFYNNRASQTEAALLFGFKAPTGAIDRRDTAGELFEAEFQPGSGSWDGLLGFAFTQRFGPWSFDSNVLYVFAGTGTQDTNLGNRFLYNTAVSYRLLGFMPSAPGTMVMSHSPAEHRRRPRIPHIHEPAPATPLWRVDAVLELNGEWHDYARTAGVRDDNSGGNVVYLSPGVRVGYSNLAGFLSFGIPVINEMNGIQAKAGYRILSGVGLAF